MEKPKERTHFDFRECSRFMEEKHPNQAWDLLEDFFCTTKELNQSELFGINSFEDEDFEGQDESIKEAFDLFVKEFGVDSEFLYWW